MFKLDVETFRTERWRVIVVKKEARQVRQLTEMNFKLKSNDLQTPVVHIVTYRVDDGSYRTPHD